MNSNSPEYSRFAICSTDREISSSPSSPSLTGSGAAGSEISQAAADAKGRSLPAVPGSIFFRYRSGVLGFSECTRGLLKPSRIEENALDERRTSILGGVVLRLVLIFHLLAAFAQSVFAGQFLSGSDSQVKFHELTGWVILVIALIQILLTAVLMRPGVTSQWLVFGSIFVFLGEVLQVGTGFGRFLDVHVPLGVIIVAAVSWQTISVFLRGTPADGRHP